VLVQVLQEVSDENKQVEEILATLASFQLNMTPSKPDNDGDFNPAHIQRRLIKLAVHDSIV